ncbi:MAG: hypothetical protein HUJ65_05800 [Oscillospiraceae bacterium]|nr:hypothetical protein [Oscillospiraceae bacterium]
MARIDIRTALLEAAEEVLGLPADEMAENMDTDLFENGLLDSMGCVAMMTYVEEQPNTSITIEDMDADDFTSLAAMEEALKRMLG